MRTLAIGDIHGCLQTLSTLLGAVQIHADDLIVTLGDYVDRGPDSNGVLDLLVEFYRTGQLIALRGNHDQMMVEVFKGGIHGSGCHSAVTRRCGLTVRQLTGRRVSRTYQNGTGTS